MLIKNIKIKIKCFTNKTKLNCLFYYLISYFKNYTVFAIKIFFAKKLKLNIIDENE